MHYAAEREVSRGHSSEGLRGIWTAPLAKGRTKWRGYAANLGRAPQKSARTSVELSSEGRVKPNSTAKRGSSTIGEEGATALGSACLGNLNISNRRMRTRMSGGVGGE